MSNRIYQELEVAILGYRVIELLELFGFSGTGSQNSEGVGQKKL